jgi:ribosomal protein S18 acetylase RimI-like enzyme
LFSDYVALTENCDRTSTNNGMELNIRTYAATDEKQLLKLWQDCCLVMPQNDPQRDISLKLQVQPELFLVGMAGPKVVASIMAGYEGHRGWLNYLAVVPKLQRKGIGRNMVAAATAKLEAMGCPKINLQIRTSNSEVIEFYKRIGFTVDDVVSMGRRL